MPAITFKGSSSVCERLLGRIEGLGVHGGNVSLDTLLWRRKSMQRFQVAGGLLRVAASVADGEDDVRRNAPNAASDPEYPEMPATSRVVEVGH